MKDKNNNLIIAGLIALVLVVFFGGLGMMGNFGYGYGGMMSNYGYGGMWIFGSLFMTLILIALVLFIVWMIKQLQGSGRK